MSEAIRLVRVTKSYPISGGPDVPVLRGIDLDIAFNELTAVNGRSGSGKSTLLHIMSGLMRPTSGEVYVGGRNIALLNDREAAAFRNRETGFIFQSFFLEPSMKAWENVALPLIVQKVPPAERLRRAKEALETVGLLDRAEHKPSQLSGGEVQRVCIARAMINRPKILFADEPTGNLDSENGANVMRLLRALVSPETAVVLVTHNREDTLLCDRTVILSDGVVIS